MLVFKIAAFAVISAIIAVMLRQYRPEIALQISIAAGLLILLAVMEQITGVLSTVSEIAHEYGIDESGLTTIFKVIGISYLAQFAADTCRDSGESALAGKVELAAKILILTLALPIIKILLESVNSLLLKG